MAKKKAKTPDTPQPSEVHDTFFRQLMSEPTTIDFVQNYLPAKLVELFDLTQLHAEKDTFVDARLRKHFSEFLGCSMIWLNKRAG